jgi:hypothetical protein
VCSIVCTSMRTSYNVPRDILNFQTSMRSRETTQRFFDFSSDTYVGCDICGVTSVKLVFGQVIGLFVSLDLLIYATQHSHILYVYIDVFENELVLILFCVIEILIRLYLLVLI